MTTHKCPACGSVLSAFADIVIEDVVGGRVRRGDATIVLPRRETQVLACLLGAAPRFVTRDRLHFHVYGHPEDGGPDPNVLESHVSKLRKALREARMGITVKCRRFEGYALAEAA